MKSIPQTLFPAVIALALVLAIPAHATGRKELSPQGPMQTQSTRQTADKTGPAGCQAPLPPRAWPVGGDVAQGGDGGDGVWR